MGADAGFEGRSSHRGWRKGAIGLSALAVLTLAAAAPGHATRRTVIQDGAIDLPLRGYPEVARSSQRPAPGVGLGAGSREPGASHPGMLSFAGRRAADLSQVVGRLGVTIAPASFVYRQRDPRSGVLSPPQPSGTYLALKGEQDGYFAVLMIDGSIGWIPATSVQLLEYDVVAEPQRPDASGFNSGLGGLAAPVLREAFKYLGVHYLWGGNGSRGIDCSGLVRNVFARCGVSLPRTAHEQAHLGAKVAFSELQAGDRLYFAVRHQSIDHTGIYIGQGYFIHASLSRGGVAVDRLTEPLYGPHLVDARRF